MRPHEVADGGIHAPGIRHGGGIGGSRVEVVFRSAHEQFRPVQPERAGAGSRVQSLSAGHECVCRPADYHTGRAGRGKICPRAGFPLYVGIVQALGREQTLQTVAKTSVPIGFGLALRLRHAARNIQHAGAGRRGRNVEIHIRQFRRVFRIPQASIAAA